MKSGPDAAAFFQSDVAASTISDAGHQVIASLPLTIQMQSG
jgi:hypothetical protein